MAEKKRINLADIGGDMPHNLEAEQALLGCLLLDPEVQNEIIPTLRSDDFYDERHKNIFNSMNELNRLNQPVDLVTVMDNLDKNGVLNSSGGLDYITGLTSVMPSAANYAKYYDLVKRDSLLRKLIKNSSETIVDCRDSKDGMASLAKAEKGLFDISQGEDSSEMEKISNVLPTVMAELDELAKGNLNRRGIKTGYRELDAIIDGVHKNDLMILAARPACGKTSLAMNMVEAIALQGYSCAVFSLEMNKEQLTTRMLCSLAKVNANKVKKGELSKTEWLKIGKAKTELAKCKIFISESAVIRPQEIISKCRRLKRKSGLDFVVIDYLQLMTPDVKKDSRQQEITDISRSLKMLAMELSVPVLALSQLSRDIEKRKTRPQLSDLRESGAIEQDADIVMFIHRPDIINKEKPNDQSIKPNVAEICIEKHRNGDTGTAELYFMGAWTKFLNINPNTGVPEYGDEVMDAEANGKPIKIEEETSVKAEPTSVDDELYGNED